MSSEPRLVCQSVDAVDGQVTLIDSPFQGVGHKLRCARLAAGISVREMGRRVNVSSSFISQVELGRTKPSVGTLYSLATELGVPLDDLMPVAQPASADSWGDESTRTRAGLLGKTVSPSGLDGSDGNPVSPVQRAGRRHELRMDKAVWGRLTADHDAENDFLHVVYSPGGESCPADRLIHHPGREYGYIVTGMLNVQVGFAHYELNAGDAINFDSMTPHRLHNSSEGDSFSLWMVVGRGGTPVL